MLSYWWIKSEHGVDKSEHDLDKSERGKLKKNTTHYSTTMQYFIPEASRLYVFISFSF